jgi:hypothetical protein
MLLRKNFKYSIVFGLIAGITLLYSFSSNPLNGRTGPPCDINLCTNCHNGGGALDGTLTIIGLPDTINPNTKYDFTVSLNNPNLLAHRAGFQMTAMNSSNVGTGEFITTDPSATVQPAGTKQYLEHNPAKNFPGTGDNIVSYSGSWTSPSGPIGEIITFCTAGNIANGNGSSAGDRIVQMSFELSLQGTSLQANIIDIQEPSCFGFSDGSASVEILSGSPDYTYKWDNGETTATATALNAGTHSVTVADAQLDSIILDLTINQPDSLTVSSIEITNASDETATDGSISVTVAGGTPPYSFVWTMGDDIVSTTEDLNGVMMGDYLLTIIDANSCRYTSLPHTVQDIISNIQDDFWIKHKIYPNPIIDRLFLDLRNDKQINYRISLFDSSNRLVFSQLSKSSSLVEMNCGQLSKGIYYLQIETEDQKSTFTKLVKI